MTNDDKEMVLKAVKIILLARKLISKESNWSQWSHARNSKYQTTRPTSGNAVQWSLSGSLAKAWHVAEKDDMELLENVFKHIQHYAKNDIIEIYDASHTHKEVLALLARSAKGALRAKKLFV